MIKTKRPAAGLGPRRSEEPGVGAPGGSAEGASDIDPRIQQRRIEVKRAEGRRRLRLLLIILALVVVVSGGWALTRSPLLDVDRIVVNGAQHTGAADIAKAAHLDDGAYMTAVNLRSAAHRVEALPWVDHASLSRRWPGTIVVTVRERVPAASAPTRTGGWAFVDRTGRVLTRISDPNPDRPVLEGVTPVDAPGSRLSPDSRAALRVAVVMSPELATQVIVVRLVGGEVELALRPEGVVRLGTTDRLADKLAAVETLLARIDLRRLTVLDVRAPASPTVVRRDEPPPVPTTTVTTRPAASPSTTVTTAPTATTAPPPTAPPGSPPTSKP